MFDVVVQHINISVSSGDYLMHDKVQTDGDSVNKQELSCVFWDSKISNWSSDGCITLFEDDELKGNIFPKGRVFTHINVFFHSYMYFNLYIYI